ncbi:tetratricopeptide repeat protein 12-like isoform X2 [Hydractinia symbiolongicarpus]|uniref:tetratricopeptide repeat protein 12-like isoform X2 n=1 Tax=Hydractinia symbiolongicarpus TaxID=13093 RepID=UPI00254C807D|nr:tetratricopeptide repeat protein 12-like isoform X2 [Hydractinia symbiolongicarpus]
MSCYQIPLIICFVRSGLNPYKLCKIFSKRMIFHFFVTLFSGSLITDLSNVNVDLDESIKKADTYLENTNSVKNDCFDRSVINKIDDTQQNFNTHSMSTEDFMKDIENDAKERTERKKQNKEKATVLKEKGNVYFKEKHYKEAIDCYTIAINLISDEVIFYSNRAQAYIKMKKYELALKDCEIALKIDKTFTKIYVHKGRALTGLNKFEEAKSVFNEALKIDKKQSKLLQEYLCDVEKAEEMAFKVEKVNNMMKIGNTKMNQIIDFVSRLRKGDSYNINDTLTKLNALIVDDEHRCCFRVLNGFNMFSENPKLNRQLQMDSEDFELITCIIALLSNVAAGNEENSILVCNVLGISHAAVKCLDVENTLESKFESIQMFYRLSQFNKSREMVVKDANMEILLQQSLYLISRGGDMAIVTMGMVNNLSLDNNFTKRFEEKLSKDFIPGILKMMELLSLPYDDEPNTITFLPVMSSSISTVANLFRKKELRKMASTDDKFWITSCKLLMKYMEHLEVENKCDIVLSTLGMLMNLSADKVTLNEATIADWITLFSSIFSCCRADIVERGCGVLNHILGHNQGMLKIIVNRRVYLEFFSILKGDNANAKKYIIKCLALCTDTYDAVLRDLYKENVLQSLLKMLESTEQMVVGNTALCLTHCSRNDIVTDLIQSNLIKILLSLSTNEKFSKQVRHNCARAVGKFTLADSRYLQQVRDLHGLEILHEVMKENKLI